ncbi:hypothetical protein NQ315_001374 [Exocentrus adspersus]|uniref:Uncharacterized protein n=1 Tax=Exocentrus adspersus TaxID=1586481 RepID=A0AAV8WFQ4_9CUCU|nr:hypothetical protein NQ315_001374 [Exocentrus adspersus]
MWPLWLREPQCLCHLKALKHMRISETIWYVEFYISLLSAEEADMLLSSVGSDGGQHDAFYLKVSLPDAKPEGEACTLSSDIHVYKDLILRLLPLVNGAISGSMATNASKIYGWKMNESRSESMSIMSGDSPNTHQTDLFDFKEGRVSPAPTTSKDVGVQSGGELVQASVLVEPAKDNKEEEDNKEMSSPILNGSQDERRCSTDADDQTVQLDELHFSGSGRGEDRRQEKRKLNGEADKLDGVWVPNREPRKDTKAEEEDDNCTVKCLYYTMQCCECTIM